MYGLLGGGSVTASDFATQPYAPDPTYGGYAMVGFFRVEIPIGSLFVDVVVPLQGDTNVENDEIVTVEIYDRTSGIGDYWQMPLTILNDDVATTLSIGNVSVAEGNPGTTLIGFTVTRSDTSGSPTATYTIVDGTGSNAADGNDFAFTSQYPRTGTVTFATGSTTAVIYLPVTGDFAVEANETFTVTLSNPAGATIATGAGTATVTIVNDDAGGTLTIGDVTVTEGDAGTSLATFTLSRSGGDAPLEVTYRTADGDIPGKNALAGTDYVATFGQVSFAAGQTSAGFSVALLGDTLREGDEQFRVLINDATYTAMLPRSFAVATIVDNDSIPGAQYGSAGNDILIADQPDATLAGGAGDDTYLVHNQRSVVIEVGGEGVDIVYSDASYNLGGNAIEALSTLLHLDTTAINLTGNYLSQQIIGNYGDNLLNGGSGVDTLIGLYGNDLYAVGDSRIVIVESDGQGSDTVVASVDYALGVGVSVEVLAAQDRGATGGLALSGNGFAQVIAGTAGADTINGGGGSDVLLGGAGNDRFDFTTALGAGNVDGIADFAAGDRIRLASDIFSVGRSLAAGAFVPGTAALDADDRIVYDGTSGRIFYDADGSGAGAAMLFALVAPGSALNAATFEVIAPTPTIG
ncbi:Calx-beta domain-containing protein [Sphingomonas sp. M1-B02]|uniref:Calx-beta domain-containing protein n=1 Tax=Sphingomonas sp. M1-B02 TaxID=3114300 RepID=UPI00223EF34D|nr:Calx-beta domain-containing protein [Sphingomonas sp. S6-11]UZK66482.1 hypothetical protein OKW87_01175 [Sphingomonas sp. S6-11]